MTQNLEIYLTSCQVDITASSIAVGIEDGEVVGMLTVTDALESVAGDVEDPVDRGRVAVTDG